jgi:hypothetical protein
MSGQTPPGIQSRQIVAISVLRLIKRRQRAISGWSRDYTPVFASGRLCAAALMTHERLA